MVKDGDTTSPFKQERDIEPMIIREENPRVTHSPLHDLMYKQIEERARNRDISPSKYSYSVDQVRTLR
jgi:hypothetical protein